MKAKVFISAGCALPVSGYETTADYGMGLVPILHFWTLLFDSAAMDGRFLTCAQG
jgi:hypothetical protein